MEDKTDKVSMVYTVMAFTMPLLLVVIVGLSVYLKAHNKVFANFEDFKRFLLLIESLFAAYTGMFVYSLFEKLPPLWPLRKMGLNETSKHIDIC